MNTLFRPSRFFFATLLSLLSVSGFLFPRSAGAQGQTSMGTDFWLGFMPNSFALGCCPPQNCAIYIGSGTANDVHVDVYGGSTTGPVETYHTQMLANSIWAVPARSEQAWEDYSPEQPVYYGIHVYSTNPMVVYGYQYSGPNTSSTDSYLGIPTSALGTEYYSACWYDDHYILGSGWYEENQPLAGQFMVISPFDNNVITIGPVKTDTRADPIAATILHHAGDTWNVTLMKGQTYLVQSTGLQFGDADLTGTHITSSQPIALVSGHQLCSVPIGELPPAGNGSKDELLEMIPPLQEWGTQYYMMPTATRTVCGDLVRVIAGEDNETITLTGATRSSQATLLHAGDFYDFDEVTEPTTFASVGGKKFLAEDILYSAEFDGDPNGNADPSSIVLTSREQFQKKMIFEPPDRTGVSGFIHYATFLCENDSIQHIQISGHPISFYPPAGQSVIPGTNPLMGCYRIQVPIGIPLVATCGAPFACYMYGFAQYETYGNPAGMALGIPSPDTLPPLEKHDSTCGVFHAELMELRHIPQFSFDDTRIADVAMITDTLDLRWPKPSYNFSFAFDPAHPFQSGDSTAFYDLTVINPAQDAYAAVWTTDRAGNDTVYQYYYTTPTIKFTPPLPLQIQPVRVTADSCENLTLVNQQNNDLIVTQASIDGIDTAGKFTMTAPALPKTLHPGDTLTLNLCFSPSDTISSWDTLRVKVGECASFRYPMEGLGVTPLIIAGDLDFGNVTVGDTICKLITVRNVGKASLTLGKNWSLGDPADFSFSDATQLPVTIPAGGSVTLNFCFHPQTTGPLETLQNWATDLPAPFAHQIKDTSQLLGFGVQGGLNWDRPKQGFWTECSNPVIDTVNLINPSTGGVGENISVDSVKIIGQDADEFTIVGNGTGNPTPPPSWNLLKDQTIPVYLQFTPKLAKGYILRSAQIVAYGSSGNKTFAPTIDLSGTVRHATIRITPPLYDFGTVQPGTDVTTSFWIHNDGDTVLSLASLTINGGFTISGYTPGEQVPPGDSVPVTIDNNNVPLDTTFATLAAGDDFKLCTSPDSAIIRVASTSFIVAAIGHDYGNVYVCQNDSAVLEAKNLGSDEAVLEQVQIFDTLGTQGAPQFTFDNGTQLMGDLEFGIHTGDSQAITVNYNPVVGGGLNTYVAFTFNDFVTGKDTTVYQLIEGTPLHYINTLSVQNGTGPNVYTAYPGQTVTVPVRMNTTLDVNASIYSIQFVLRYKRDMFIANPVVADNGLNLVSSDTMTDPSDPTYILNTVTVRSSSPITGADSTIAHIQLQYVLNKDSISYLQVMNPVYFDQSGNAACWVAHDTVPSEFAGLDRCGDLTLQTLLKGGTVSFHIRKITPNPVSNEANIGLNVQLDGIPLRMDIYNILGQKELTILDAPAVPAGDHTTTFGTSLLQSGQYVLRVTDGTSVQSIPFVVEK